MKVAASHQIVIEETEVSIAISLIRYLVGIDDFTIANGTNRLTLSRVPVFKL